MYVSREEGRKKKSQKRKRNLGMPRGGRPAKGRDAGSGVEGWRLEAGG